MYFSRYHFTTCTQSIGYPGKPPPLLNILMLTPEDIKRKTGEFAAGFVQSGMSIGLGTGTTVYWLIQALGKRCKEGLDLVVVPTSTQSEKLAKEAGIRTGSLNDIDRLPLAIDGADEIDPAGQLIKGGGGALLREKIVAAAADKLLIIADHTKLVDCLGAFPLPIEVVPFGYRQVMNRIGELGMTTSIRLREKEDRIFVSDQGHYILDCSFNRIIDASWLNTTIHDMPGVVETGLFIGMADEAIIGYDDGSLKTIKY